MFVITVEKKPKNAFILPLYLYILEKGDSFFDRSKSLDCSCKIAISRKDCEGKRLDVFFALMVDGVQRVGKNGYVIKGLAS